MFSLIKEVIVISSPKSWHKIIYISQMIKNSSDFIFFFYLIFLIKEEHNENIPDKINMRYAKQWKTSGNAESTYKMTMKAKKKTKCRHNLWT